MIELKEPHSTIVELSRAFEFIRGQAADLSPELQVQIMKLGAVTTTFAHTHQDNTLAMQFATQAYDALFKTVEEAIKLKADLLDSHAKYTRVESAALRARAETLKAYAQAHFAEQDSEEARRRLADTQRLTLIDTLTELPNRRAFDSAMDTAVRLNGSPASDSDGEKRYYGVLALDIDWFKRVNDELGHAGGDEALKAAAERLQNIIRRQPELCDFASPAFRYGGEEIFSIIEVNAPNRKIAIQKLAEIHDRIMKDLEGLYVTHENVTVPLNFSSGLHVITRRDTVQTAVAVADTALYADKENLDGKYARYKRSLEILKQNPNIDANTIKDISPPRMGASPALQPPAPD